MSAPSFLYSGIDKETLSLSEELSLLGGGDAQACHFELHGVVSHDLAKGDQQLVWQYDNMIGLRDTSLPQGSPVSKSMKYFTVDSIINQDAGFSRKFDDVALDATQWVQRGFNSCILTFGMRGVGKSDAMFGQFGVEKEDYKIANCLAGSVLDQLFQRKQQLHSREGSTLTIALSAWSVQLQEITDLLAPVRNAAADPLDFVSVECPDLSAACRLLHESRARARGCLAHDVNVDPKLREGDRGHYFCRILLHQRDGADEAGAVSYMYLVDLAGLYPVDGLHFRQLSEEDRIAARAHNLQLQCLLKVLNEMQTLSKTAHSNPLSAAQTSLTAVPTYGAPGQRQTRGGRDTYGASTAGSSIMRMTSARDSRLTTLLAPIIQGNVKTSILLFLQDGVSKAKETYNLLNGLDGVRDILSACHKVKVSVWCGSCAVLT
jgi:hypothetical protein